LLGVSVAALAAAALVPSGVASAAPTYVSDPASLVDPIIGTSGAVDDFPGADVPFGMVQWSPDTPSRPAGGGYEYNDSTTTGFSLTHISGPGCAASGDIPILPTSGAVGSNPGSATMPLDHSDETAQAGYYKLASGGITSELTSTLRTGSGRFTFPSSAQANLILKLSDSAAGSSATSFKVVGPKEIQGSVTSGNFCGASDKYTLYFDMTFDHAITGYGTYQNSAVSNGTASSNVTRNLAPSTTSGQAGTLQPKSSNGTRQIAPKVNTKASAAAPVEGADGAYVSFDTSKKTAVNTNVGISYVSTANAKKNRTTEDPTYAFDTVKAAATKSWNTILSKIQIGGGDTDAQKTFYTAMYHALLHPNVFSDVNGQYAGFDGQVHKAAAGHVEYANYSGWDIYRSQVQLAATVAPQQTSDSVRSMLNQYAQTGQLPKWALNNGESYVMVGDPSDAIIADAYAFGARDFDTSAALTAMEHEANTPNNVRPALTQYLGDGYIPEDGQYGCCNFYGAVSTQQEYNTADHAIASFASAIGQSGVSTQYQQRANNWQNVFNPATGYMQPKDSTGVYTAGFSPTSSTGFVEGSSAQYTPMEPFDIAGLIAADGGNAAWNAKLDSLTSTIKNPSSANADFGNEPSIEIPWEYDYSGEPWKAQSTVRSIQQQIFTNEPAGIAGNDDLGTMSAWYVWSALGFYPETPGTTDMALGSPVFANTAIHLPNGKTLTESAPAASTTNQYVQSMTSNGASWSHAYLDPSLITNGGTVSFALGSTPNKSFAAAAGDAPPSDTTGLASALGYTDQSVVVTAPGTPATVKVGVRNLTSTKQTVSWAAGKASTGTSTGPTSGSLVLKKNGTGTATVAITAPTTEGRYDQTFTFRDGNGNPLPSVTVEVDVAKPGELWPYYNDAGIASDGQSTTGSYDGEGWSYSSQALAAAGITPGGTVTSDGLSYTFPDTQPGDLDNIQAGGQTVPLSGTAGATKLGILGSATNGNPDSTGSFVVHYTDGTSQTVTLGFSDWTLNAGSSKPTSTEQQVADTTYRDTSSGGRDTVDAYLFTTSAALTAGKTVQSVTLPTTTTAGPIHVFAFAIG
jgi:predicted alpha-1,2-mannosidase